jgi:hypothetical protein
MRLGRAALEGAGGVFLLRGYADMPGVLAERGHGIPCGRITLPRVWAVPSLGVG